MKKTILIIVLGLLCLNFTTYSQVKSSVISPLKIGEAIPRELLELPLNLINQKGKIEKIMLNDFTGKLVILDFWASWCSPCIGSLRRLDSLQKLIGENLYVLPSTYEGADTASRSLLKYEIKLSSVFGQNNQILNGYFPHRFLPHQVWIKDGRVKAITSHYETNETNVRAAIAGDTINIKAKEDITNFNWSTPLSKYAEQKNVAINTQITLSPFIDGLGSDSGSIIQGSNRIVFMNNQPILAMYSWGLGINVNRIVPILKSVNKLAASITQENRFYCLQVITPIASDDVMKNQLVKALNWSFQLSGQFKKRRVECYVIKRGKVEVRNSSSNHVADTGKIRVANLVSLLNRAGGWLPNQPIFLNESEFDGEITFKLPATSLNDMSILVNTLSAAGLLLEREKRELQMFELTRAE